MFKVAGNNRAGHTRRIWHLFKNRKNHLQMFRAVIDGSYRISLWAKVTAPICIAYIIFPFDLLPDYIPVLGWVDDSVVLILLMDTLRKETERFIRHKAMQRKKTLE